MSLRALQLLLAVQGLLPPCGCEPAGLVFEDFSALLQQTGDLEPGRGPQSLELRGQWPQHDTLWDEVKASVKDLTEQVGDLTDQAAQRVDQVRDQVRAIANHTAQKITAALNHALETIGEHADALLNGTQAEKAQLLGALQTALNASNATILPRFAELADGALGSTSGRWRVLRATVGGTAVRISGGLSDAGQDRLASQFAQMIDSSLASIDGFLSRLQEAAQSLHGIGVREVQEAEGILLSVNGELNQALTYVAAFVRKFEQTFRDVAETISDALQLATGEVDPAFASVQQSAAAVSRRAQTAARDMLLGLHRSIADVMEVSNMTTPQWRPVSMPPDMAAQGSAVGLRLPLAAVLAAVLGAVIAAEGC